MSNHDWGNDPTSTAVDLPPIREEWQQPAWERKGVASRNPDADNARRGKAHPKADPWGRLPTPTDHSNMLETAGGDSEHTDTDLDADLTHEDTADLTNVTARVRELFKPRMSGDDSWNPIRHLRPTKWFGDDDIETVALGTGTYGHIVNIPVASFKRPVLVFGTIRSGKTSTALSLISQTARGGIIAVCLKGDAVVPEHWARYAVANNRKFKHFTLANTSGAPYTPPIPGVPDKPACYDPLRHGNADSRTDMLLGSVPRDGDAAAYLRSSREFVMIAWQVAEIVGKAQGRSSFAILHNLCDVGYLNDLLDTRGPDGRLIFNPEVNPQHRTLMERVKKMEVTYKADALLRAAVVGTQQLVSSFVNGAAAGPWLRSGDSQDNDIDLFDAITQGHVVVFSLPVQDYPELASILATMILLDLSNTVASLRKYKDAGNTWEPGWVQFEEFGSARLDVVLNLINKCGDVDLRVLLSTQSWHDVTALGDGDVTAHRILAQAGNIFSFSVGDEEEGELLASLTPPADRLKGHADVEVERTRFTHRIKRAQRTEKVEGKPLKESSRQALASDFQQLGKNTRHNNRRATWKPKYECLWIAKHDGGRVAHTHASQPNLWVERIQAVLCPPEATARRFPEQVYPDMPDRPLRYAEVELIDAIVPDDEAAAALATTDAWFVDSPPADASPRQNRQAAPKTGQRTAGAKGRAAKGRRPRYDTPPPSADPFRLPDDIPLPLEPPEDPWADPSGDPWPTEEPAPTPTTKPAPQHTPPTTPRNTTRPPKKPTPTRPTTQKHSQRPATNNPPPPPPPGVSPRFQPPPPINRTPFNGTPNNPTPPQIPGTCRTNPVEDQTG